MTTQGPFEKAPYRTNTTYTGSIPQKTLDKVVAVHTDTYDISAAALGTDVGPGYWKNWRFIGLIIALCLGYNSANLGYVLSSYSLTRIDNDIGPSKNLLWVPLAYTLSLSVSFLLVGRFSDIFGRRWFFIVGNAFAIIGCIMGGTAKNINTIVGGNVFNGLGAAIQISFAAAVCELVPNKHRDMWCSVIFASALPTIGFGAPIAAALGTETALKWRWAFYLGLIVSGIVFILLFVCYHPPNFHLLHTNRTKWQQIKRLNFVGLFFYVIGLILLLMGLNWGGSAYPWKSAHVIATIIVGTISIAIFVIYDIYHKGDPLLPMHLFKSRGFAAIIATASVGSCVYYSMIILWPSQIASLFGGSAIHQALLASMVGTGTQLGQFMAGPMMHYIPYQRGLLFFTACLLTAMAGAMIAVGPGSVSLGCGIMFTACWCVGVLECVAVVLTPLSCPPEDLGAALGALGSIRSTAATCATAIYVAILDNKLASITPAVVSNAALKNGLPVSSLPTLLLDTSTGNFTNVPGITPRITLAVGKAVQEASSRSFQYVWYAVVAFGVLAIIASSLTTNYNEHLTDEVARKMQDPKLKMVVGEMDREK